ncbi:MAG: tyrosine-type recombinase/integrase [Rhodobacteraceae bacterium]|nr:tyrosine-type recombinase/integrase [Paracoccaceae bacterium]
MGDKIQIRKSTGTSDKTIAMQRKFDLEGALRDQVLAAARQASLSDEASHYQQAVLRLKLVDRPYYHAYDDEVGDVLLRRMSNAPSHIDHIALAAKEFNRVLLRLKKAELEAEDHNPDLSLLKEFDLNPPSADEADILIKAAVSELHKSFGTPEAIPTVSSTLVGTYQRTLEQRVKRKDMKSKTAKARMNNIKQFVDMIGDLPLDEVEATHAYAFADQLGKEFANSTVKTRVSDVSTLFEDAVRSGRMKHNPFTNLKLRSYGKRGQHYTPLSDELLTHLFAIPKLRLDIKRIWAILVCTGMRLDEVATLQLHQIKEKDGIFNFDLTNAAVKNANSQRRVPICRTLEPLIRQIINERARRENLFDFRVNSDGKTRASSLCVYWMAKANLNKESGDTTARYTTHSLRGSFKDKMRDAEVAQEVHNAILGHDQHTVGAAYGRGPSLNIMKSAVDKANHPYLDWIAPEGRR